MRNKKTDLNRFLKFKYMKCIILYIKLRRDLTILLNEISMKRRGEGREGRKERKERNESKSM
jgi:hypothetical protein